MCVGTYSSQKASSCGRGKLTTASAAAALPQRGFGSTLITPVTSDCGAWQAYTQALRVIS